MSESEAAVEGEGEALPPRQDFKPGVLLWLRADLERARCRAQSGEMIGLLEDAISAIVRI